MPTAWYPQEKEKLTKLIDELMNAPAKKQKVNGLIVPHAGYEFSGKIAGKAFAMLKNSKKTKAIVIGPSHYTGFEGVRALKEIETPLGKINIIKNNFKTLDYEHSVDNEIPFLQRLGFKEILPLVTGEISKEKAKEIALEISKIKDAVFIFSTDLSHFMQYDKAVDKDRKTIRAIENCEKCEDIDACGKSALIILMELCKLKKYKPELIEYKNSGDITGDKTSVVGYSSFYF